jgi:pseudaminic acid cytidylyltransferase
VGLVLRNAMTKKVVAIITARGGSKRIPGKNVKPFLGKPIINYSIEAALKSGIFHEVMISTDDERIAEIAKQAGAKVPFMRSAEMSNDFATTADVLIEVLHAYQKQAIHFDYGCCLYPTAPFVTAEKLMDAWRKIQQFDADSVIPVTAFSFPVWRAFLINNDRLQFAWPENALKRSQDLPPAYHDCGQFYFFNAARFLKTRQLLTDNTIPIVVPETEVQDIDNPEDWKLAEIKYSFLKR